MFFLRLVIVVVLLGVLVLGSWYYRPWADYSPSKMAVLEEASLIS